MFPKRPLYLSNVLLILIFSGCLATEAKKTDSNMLAGGEISLRIKPISKMPDLAPQLAQRIQEVVKRGPKNHVRKVISKELKDALIQQDSGTALVKGNPNSTVFLSSIVGESKSLDRMLTRVVFYNIEKRSYERAQSIESNPEFVQILAGDYSHKTLNAERNILSKMLISDMLQESYIEFNQLRTQKSLNSNELARLEELEALINIIESGLVPQLDSNKTLDKVLVRRTDGEVDLNKTLAQARLVDLDNILFSRQQILPTPKDDLMKVLTQSEKNLIDSMGSTYYWLAKGTVKTSMPIMNCFLSAIKLWADCRQDLKRFDSIISHPKMPRVNGEVFRGLSNVPTQKLEKWLTSAAQGQTLYLGLDNTPESVFAARIPEIAKEYLGDSCRPGVPDTFDVLLVINQRGGVSVETILTDDESLKPVILSKEQKFRLVEIFKTDSRRRVVIKLDEI
jgi:hypothetical protein